MTPDEEAARRRSSGIPTLAELNGDVRALRHDFRGLETRQQLIEEHTGDLSKSAAAAAAAAAEAASTVRDLGFRIRAMEEPLTLAGFLDGPDSMSPRELKTTPAQARSWISHGEAADTREELVMRRVVMITAAATAIQAMLAALAIYLAHH